MSIYPIILPIFFYFRPINNSDDFYSAYNGVHLPCFILFLLVFFLETLKNVTYKITNFLLCTFFLIVYLIVLQFPYISIFNITSILTIVAPLFLLKFSPGLRPNRKEVYLFFYVAVVLETIFCVLNSYGVLVYPILSTSGSSHLISGTFARYNHLTNFLTTIYIFIAIDFFDNRKSKTLSFILLTIIIGILVFYSGARMSVILYSFTLLSCLFSFKKKSFRKSFPIIILLCVFSFVIVYIAQSTKSEGLIRNFEGLYSFINSSSDNDESTISLSTFLLSQEFDNPFFGNGYEYKGEMAYHLGVYTLRNFRSDAKVAYIMVEYGLICFLIYVLLYYFIYKDLLGHIGVKKKKNLIIFYLYFFLLTISESGFFDVFLFPLIYLYAYSSISLLNRKERLYKII